MSTATRGPTSGGELIDPPRPNATIRVITGRVAVTRLYDLAYEADLSMIEREASPSAVRLRLTRARPQAVFYSHPPLDIHLGSIALGLPSETVEAEMSARIHAFGAVRLSIEIPVRDRTWSAYTTLLNELDHALEDGGPWDAHLARVHELIEPALSKPSETDLVVHHVFAVVGELDPPLTGEECRQRLDLLPVLTGEDRTLSEAARRDVLRHAYTYYVDDLVVIGPSRALIVEPGGAADVVDILSTAQAQLLELRYYDDLLDDELPRMYDRMERARRAFTVLARRRYAALARSLQTLLAEVTEVAERIDNALVVTEDVYLAKVYAAALDQYRVRDWGAAVDRKLAIIRDAYTGLYDEATSARAEYLEITIVLLIALEIVLALFVW